jgi:predicted CopG family antitoxin
MNSTILIRNKTREKLKEIGKKSQTYDDIINELINRKITGKNAHSLVTNRVSMESQEGGR